MQSANASSRRSADGNVLEPDQRDFSGNIEMIASSRINSDTHLNRTDEIRIPKFFSGHIPTHREPTQPQHMIRKLSWDTTLPKLDDTNKWAPIDLLISINRSAQIIAGIASPQRPTTSSILKPGSTNTILFDIRNKKLKASKNCSIQCLKSNPKWQKEWKSNLSTHIWKNTHYKHFTTSVQPTKELFKRTQSFWTKIC